MDLKLWIRKSGNGLYLVDKETKAAGLMNKAEYVTHAFNNISELAKWIENGG
jgi:hypothetical protein